MTPSLYDLLDVDPTASDEEIRAAWKAAIADLDPTDRRFRAYNQAAEVLLDPARRAAYDAELAEQDDDETAAAPAAPAAPVRLKKSREPKAAKPAEPARPARPAASSGGATATTSRTPRRSVPGWLLAVLAVLALATGGTAAYVATTPSDTSVEDATRAAQGAAERAVVPILSYDYRRLDEDQAAAQPLMTQDYREEYDKLFEVLQQNAPRTKTVVGVEVVASGVVRSGTDRAEFLVFLNRPTTNAENKEPVVYKDQVRVQMENVGGDWLVDCLLTSPNDRCE